MQFEAAVTARGGIVHWARDAAEANRIVVGLVQATGADEVVKVKSMATQEIALNEALEAAGIAALETDLAELIVQLGHDKPSHILVPAIHRNRAEIREIFLREMADVDPELTDAPVALAGAARKHLRRKFLSARVAISGANFGIAETGTLAVVESEGNGRMCLTLPQTLITVMGIEKLVPRFADLEVFLQLLPRSSTGERMNPYTSMWTGVTPGDGPQEFHVVLLDNGRTAVLADEHGRDALNCIRCSACLNVCPVYERAGGHAYGSVYPGPIGAILSPQLTGIEDNASLPYASSLCGACYDVCPVKIDIPTILVHLRAQHTEAYADEHSRAEPGGGGDGGGGVRDEQPDPLATGPAQRAAGSAPRPQARDDRGAAVPPGPAVDRSPRPAPAAGADLPRLVGARAFRRRGRQAMTAREEVLARIASAHRAAPPPDLEYEAVARGYRTTSDLGPEALVELLVDRLVDYKALVRRCAEGELPHTIAAAWAERGITVLVVPEGLDPAWLDAGPAEIRRDRSPDELSVADLDTADGVLTTCAVAVAETGTLILDGSAGMGRRVVTLIPDYHLCVVRTDQICADVPQALAQLEPTRPLTMISGPSATSDIELNRVEGVHGPRTLEVIIVGAG